MAVGLSLEEWLSECVQADVLGLGRTTAAIAKAARSIGDQVSCGLLAGHLGATSGCANADGDGQTTLDVLANDGLVAALREVPVAAVASEELDRPIALNPDAPLIVAIDPLDGSSNIDVNVSIGTIFSIRPAPAEGGDALAAFLRPGTAQLAAGFVVYGPQTALVLTLGAGVQIFILDRAAGAFRLAAADVRIPADAREYAINTSNARYWDEPVRAYVEDCVLGADGPRVQNFNTRWIASLVAEAYRILIRGGVFLYPADGRPAYRQGRLRLVYEANPIALIAEQAGGAATDGVRRILDIEPAALHQRTPFVFGSADEVACIARYHAAGAADAERSPLFGRRGLLRA